MNDLDYCLMNIHFLTEPNRQAAANARAELAALRQQVEREQQLCRENADAALWLKNELETAKQQVDVCAKALEKAEKYISGTGQWFSEREKTPVLWQIRQALAAVKAAGGQGE